MSNADPSLTPEQKFAAILALDPSATLNMRQPGDWYVLLHNVEMKSEDGDGVLRSVGGDGTDPFDAIVQCFLELRGYGASGYLVLDAYRSTRRHVRWNGFMWVDVTNVYPVGSRS